MPKKERAVWIAAIVAVVLIATGAWLVYRPRSPTEPDAERHRQVIVEVKDWIARASEQAKTDEEYARQLLRRASAYVALGDMWNALFDYEEVIDRFETTEHFVHAVEQELKIGIKLIRGEIVEGRFGGAEASRAGGEELLVRVSVRLPRSSEAEQALFELAEHYVRIDDRQMAALAYEQYLQLFPSGPRSGLVLERFKKLSVPKK